MGGSKSGPLLLGPGTYKNQIISEVKVFVFKASGEKGILSVSSGQTASSKASKQENCGSLGSGRPGTPRDFLHIVCIYAIREKESNYIYIYICNYDVFMY